MPKNLSSALSPSFFIKLPYTGYWMPQLNSLAALSTYYDIIISTIMAQIKSYDLTQLQKADVL